LQLVLGGTTYAFELPVTTGQAIASNLPGSVAPALPCCSTRRRRTAGSPLAAWPPTVTTDGTLLISDLARRDLDASVVLRKPVAQAAIDGGSATTIPGRPDRQAAIAGYRAPVDRRTLAFSLPITGSPRCLAQLAIDFAALVNGSANPAACAATRQ
jgi:hypothetical protein